MNEETTIPSETGDSVPSESSALEVEETNPASVFETVDSSQGLEPYFTDPTTGTEAAETLPYYVTVEETVAETVDPVTVEIVEALRYDIVFSNLCSAFLICGTLVGSIIFRKIYGT